MTLYEAINSARGKKPVVYHCKLYDRIGSIYMAFEDNDTVVSLVKNGKVSMIVKDTKEIYDCDKFIADVAKIVKEKKEEGSNG